MYRYSADVTSRTRTATITLAAANQREAHKLIREQARRTVPEFWFNGRVVGGLQGVRRVHVDGRPVQEQSR